jgi:DNA-binding transcriptional ArsR family regulator
VTSVSAQRQDTQAAVGRAISLAEVHKALSHELRVKILTYLTERQAGAAEMARAFGAPTPDVSHHVKQLVKYGLVELADVKYPARGSPVKLYRATERPLITNEEVAQLPGVLRNSFAGQVFQKVLADAQAGLEINAFAKRSDWHLTRTPMELDRKGWVDMRAIHMRALNETFEVQKESQERLAKSDETSVRVSSSQLCFLIPEA